MLSQVQNNNGLFMIWKNLECFVLLSGDFTSLNGLSSWLFVETSYIVLTTLIKFKLTVNLHFQNGFAVSMVIPMLMARNSNCYNFYLN